jgi:uncharacterized protein YgiM (DUF1202 family)
MRNFIFFLVLCWAGSVWADTASITGNANANLRSGKTDAYRVIRSLPVGTQVEVLAVDQEHAKVRTKDGDIGWVPLRLLQVVRTAQPSEDSVADSLQQTQAQLKAAQQRLSEVQDELEQERDQARVKDVMLVAVAVVALAIGMFLGMALLELYYRKRLNGLRI